MRRCIAILTLLALGTLCSPSTAATQHRGGKHAGTPGSTCAGLNPASALYQYCEPVPTSTGGSTPGPGSPSARGTLPPAVVAQITHAGGSTGATARKLLSLPAANPIRPRRKHEPGAPAPTGSVSTDSLLPTLLLILLAIALAMAAAAYARHRLNRRGSHSSVAP